MHLDALLNAVGDTVLFRKVLIVSSVLNILLDYRLKPIAYLQMV